MNYTAPEKLELRKIYPCPTYSIFNCLPRPDSVHKLLPNNIEVIGAMGDSLTSGVGAKEINSFTTIEDRGVSWSIGGEKDSLKELKTLTSKIF